MEAVWYLMPYIQLDIPFEFQEIPYQDLLADLNRLRIYGSDRWLWSPFLSLPSGDKGGFFSPDIPEFCGISVYTAEWLVQWWEMYLRCAPLFDPLLIPLKP